MRIGLTGSISSLQKSEFLKLIISFFHNFWFENSTTRIAIPAGTLLPTILGYLLHHNSCHVPTPGHFLALQFKQCLMGYKVNTRLLFTSLALTNHNEFIRYFHRSCNNESTTSFKENKCCYLLTLSVNKVK